MTEGGNSVNEAVRKADDIKEVIMLRDFERGKNIVAMNQNYVKYF